MKGQCQSQSQSPKKVLPASTFFVGASLLLPGTWSRDGHVLGSSGEAPYLHGTSSRERLACDAWNCLWNFGFGVGLKLKGLFDIDYLIAGRVLHLPAVQGFGGVKTGVIVPIGKNLWTRFTHLPDRRVLNGEIRIRVDPIAPLLGGRKRFKHPLPGRLVITCPQPLTSTPPAFVLALRIEQ